MSARHRNQGFTLIEVLVALALTAIILAAMYGTFFSARNAIEVSGGALLKLHEARTALEMIRLEVESAITDQQSKRMPFQIRDRDIYGQQTSELEFHSLATGVSGPGHLRYEVIKGKDDTLQLMRRITQVTKDIDDDGREGVLVADIMKFDIEAEQDEGRHWIRTWDDYMPPPAVRISLSIRLHGAEMPLSVTVRPKIGARL